MFIDLEFKVACTLFFTFIFSPIKYKKNVPLAMRVSFSFRDLYCNELYSIFGFNENQFQGDIKGLNYFYFGWGFFFFFFYRLFSLSVFIFSFFLGSVVLFCFVFLFVCFLSVSVFFVWSVCGREVCFLNCFIRQQLEYFCQNNNE